MKNVINKLFKFTNNLQAERGATMVEYGLILAIIAVAGIAVLGSIGNKVGTKWNAANVTISSAP